jgi:hypothetical protein
MSMKCSARYTVNPMRLSCPTSCGRRFLRRRSFVRAAVLSIRVRLWARYRASRKLLAARASRLLMSWATSAARSPGFPRARTARLPQPCPATTSPRPRPRSHPTLDLFPPEETLHTHEMPGKRLAHPSRVPLRVPLTAGEVLGSKFEKSSQPGAPLRNRTVDLLLTMANQSVAVTAAGALNWADTRSREQIQAHSSPTQRCLAPQTAP